MAFAVGQFQMEGSTQRKGGSILRLRHQECSVRKLIVLSTGLGLVLVSGGAAYAVLATEVANACFGVCG